MTEQTALIPLPAHLDGWIAAWLDEKKGRTQSKRTEQVYAQTLARFRGALSQVGLDLDGPPAAIALVAQSWAGQPAPTDYPSHAKRARPVLAASNATYNQRLSIVSSFYRYLARAAEWTGVNPITKVARRPVHAYQGAHPLDPERVQRHLERTAEVGAEAERPRERLAALRDYALLLLAVTTGRRAAELAGLSWRDVEETSRGVRLTFRRAKGGKELHDLLTAEAGEALLAWLRLFYGNLDQLAPDAPLFVSLSNHQRGHRLVHSSLSRLALERLGTSKVHATRHTFALVMIQERASLAELAGALGQSSTEAAARYVQALTSDTNPYAERIASRFARRQPSA